MSKLSTKKLNLIPDPIELQKICKSISALEAIICPEWEYRYYSYQKDWSETEEFCEMRNGHGDQMLIAFSQDGTVINGFAHESRMNGWKEVKLENQETELIQEISEGVVDELPEMFKEFVFGEPVKSIGTTFCIWQTKSDNEWKIGKVELPNDEYKDGSEDLLHLLDGKPLTYKEWAEEYYEENFEESELKPELVKKIFNGEIITQELVKMINPELEDIEQLKSDLDEIGYEYHL
ncbi:MAG: hypothetical protein GY756_20785 [bacterium]|nr:hypothetical protein [bacterium]